MERETGAPELEARTVELLALIDRLEQLLQQSSLQELEVEAGETTLLLRTPGAVAPSFDARALAGLVAAAGASAGSDTGAAGAAGAGGGTAGVADRAAESAALAAADAELQSRHAVLAPLTGVFYGSPTPEAAPYVRLGGHVQEGQVIGLIEAMKLFNEIKSDASGTVSRIVAESGTLVKAKAPLIELEIA